MYTVSIKPPIRRILVTALVISHSYAMEKQLSSPIKLGLIGMGPHMTEKLIPAFDSCKFIAEYGCRQNLVALKKQQEEFGINQISTDFKDILKSNDVHAIVVAGNPEQLHVPVVKGALQTGLSIFVEKPISLSIETVREFAKLSAQSKVIAMVGFNMTHTPTADLLQEKLSRNEINEILITCSLGVKPADGPFEITFNNDYYYSFIHGVSLLRKVQGMPMDIQVCAVKTNKVLNGLYFSATCKNALNQVVSLCFSNALKPTGFNLGGKYKDQNGEVHYFNLTDKAASGGSEKQHSYKNQMDSFYTCIKEGRQPENNFQRNLEIHEIMEDIKAKLKLQIDFNSTEK